MLSGKRFTGGKGFSYTSNMAGKIDPNELLTVAQAAEERGTSRQAINYLVRQGKLKCIDIAGRRFILRKDLAEFKPDIGGRPPQAKRAA